MAPDLEAQTLNITPTTLPEGIVGVFYCQIVQVDPGTFTPPLIWTATNLPSGLSISSQSIGQCQVQGQNQARISGTPTTATPPSGVSVTVTVVDSRIIPAPRMGSRTYTLRINPPLSITTASLPATAVGLSYSQTLAATGGRGSYAWSIASGNLPPGLMLNPSNGAIAGTPSTANTFNFRVRVTDQASPPQSAEKDFSITVSPPLTITTASPLPSGISGSFYSQSFAASGGAGSFTWSVAPGSSLPAGLNLSPGGVLSGTAGAAGNFNFSIRVTDSIQTVTKQFALSIGPPLSTLSLVGIPDAVDPAQQLGFGLFLSSPHPNALSGTLSLTFVSNAVIPSDDPVVGFSTGSRSVNFTIPANSTTVVLPPQLLLLTGRVSGTIGLTASIQNGPQSIPLRSTTVRSTTPRITNVSVARIQGGLRVVIDGFSPERRLSNVEYGFNVRTSSGMQRINLPRGVSSEFENWYRSAVSTPFGSAFSLEQTFSVQGDSSGLESVVVTLTNGQGSTASNATAIPAN